MAVREILAYPDPLLKKLSEPVLSDSAEFRTSLADLIDTFEYAPGCVGISAPQIGWHERVMIIDANRSARRQKDSTLHGLLICINPQIVSQHGTLMFREGCLSVPDFTGNVFRSEQITVQYLDDSFTLQSCEMAGFEAVIAQHEIDHLNGLLFLDRVRSLKRDVFRRKKYLKPGAKNNE